MLERTTGIVLHHLKYNDDSIIVNIYTQLHGNVGFLIKVPRQKRSNVRTLLLRPLNILELDFDFRPNQTLQRINDLRLYISYDSLPYDHIKGTLALFLSEFLYHVLKHEMANPSLFQYLCNSLLWLDRSHNTQKGLANFHLVFLTRLTRFLGFWPNVQGFVHGMVFDLREATMVNSLPAHGQYLNGEESAFLPLLLRINYATMHLLRFSRQQRTHVLDMLVDYYRMHIPEFPEMKSLDVLRTVFS
ncbi:MAG: DNA repair protein RecO [Bacteroidaceae bacterium]|nr:DNA repair protein RecO [Bacteroidaceae bacterium]